MKRPALLPNRYLLAGCALFWIAFTGAAQSCTATTYQFPDQLRTDAGPLLYLNGTGVHRFLFWDVYAVALYLPIPASRTNMTSKDAWRSRILDQVEAKQIRFRFLMDVSATQLVQGWSDGFKNNHTAAQMQQLQPLLQQTYRHFRDMQSGDEITFDFRPGRGTAVSIHAQSDIRQADAKPDAKNRLPGYNFFRSALKVWLGDRPVSSRLKTCLLTPLQAQTPLH